MGTITQNLIFNVVSTFYTVTGTIKDGLGAVLPAVSVSVGSYTASTDSLGKYTITRLIPGNYNISVSKPGYFFSTSPQTLIISNVNKVVDFTGAAGYRKVTGTITKAADSKALPNITVSFSGSTTNTNTDISGNYTLTIPVTGTTTITPNSTVYKFNPVFRSLPASGADVTDVNFSATSVSELPAVANLTLTPLNASLRIAFNVLTTNVAATSYYEYNVNNIGWVQFTPTAGTPSGSTTPYTFNSIPSLSNGTTYIVQVRPVNLGLDPGITVATAGTPATAASAPTFTLAVGEAKLTLNIGAPASLGGGRLLRYSYSTDNVNWLTVPADNTITQQSVAGTPVFVNGTRYTVYVRAVTISSGTEILGIASAGLSATPASLPPAPQLNSVTAGNATLTVNFTGITAPVGSTLVRYEYDLDNHELWSALPAGNIITRETNTGTSPFLVNGVTYVVRVRAVTTLGAGDSSVAREGRPGTVPAAVASGTLFAADKRIVVAVTDGANGGYTITGYRYKLSPAYAEVALPANGAITELTNGTAYTVLVAAVNGLGTGPFKTLGSATPKAA
jgi:titin